MELLSWHLGICQKWLNKYFIFGFGLLVWWVLLTFAVSQNVSDSQKTYSMELYSISGRLTADAKIGPQAANGSSPVNFSVAIDQTHKDRATGQTVKSAKFIDCTYWVKTDQAKSMMSDVLKKGTMVVLNGIPSANAYLDKEGKPQARLNVNVRTLEFYSSRKKEQVESDPKTVDSTQSSAEVSEVPADLPF